MVISWIVENIDAKLVKQFLDYTTSRDLWRGIETVLSSGRENFDLSSRASTLTQGKNTIEQYFT